MQSAPNGIPPVAPQQISYEPQYYYTGAIAPNGMPFMAAPSGYPAQQYYQEPYAQAQPQQHVMHPGQQYIYVQQPTTMGQGPQIIYYPQMAAAYPTMYYPTQVPEAVQQGDDFNQVPSRAPMTTSTPLPTNDYQLMSQPSNVVQFKYHRNMEHDDNLIDEISKITVDSNDDTLNGEKDMQFVPRRGPPNSHPFNYKTRLCMMHASNRKCEMGLRCKFAHGTEELRTVDVPVRAANVKYKTKLCKNFSRGANGFCPYGLRCEFIHPQDKEFQNLPNYMCIQPDHSGHGDMTPEVREGPMVSRSASKNNATKVLLKHRNVAGSMMCLTNTGAPRRESNLGGGDMRSKAAFNELRGRTRSKPNLNMQMSKFSRRRSLSQLKLKWASEEQIANV